MAKAQCRKRRSSGSSSEPPRRAPPNSVVVVAGLTATPDHPHALMSRMCASSRRRASSYSCGCGCGSQAAARAALSGDCPSQPGECCLFPVRAALQTLILDERQICEGVQKAAAEMLHARYSALHGLLAARWVLDVKDFCKLQTRS